MTTDTEEIEIRTVHRNVERRSPVQISYVQITCHHCRKGKVESTGEKREQGEVHACTHESCGRRCLIPGEAFPRIVYEVPEDRPGLDGMRRIR